MEVIGTIGGSKWKSFREERCARFREGSTWYVDYSVVQYCFLVLLLVSGGNPWYVPLDAPLPLPLPPPPRWPPLGLPLWKGASKKDCSVPEATELSSPSSELGRLNETDLFLLGPSLKCCLNSGQWYTLFFIVCLVSSPFGNFGLANIFSELSHILF